MIASDDREIGQEIRHRVFHWLRRFIASGAPASRARRKASLTPWAPSLAGKAHPVTNLGLHNRLSRCLFDLTSHNTGDILLDNAA